MIIRKFQSSMMILLVIFFSSQSYARIYGEIQLEQLVLLAEKFPDISKNANLKFGSKQTGSVISICLSGDKRGFLLFQNVANSKVKEAKISIYSIDWKSILFEKKLGSKKQLTLDTGLECGNLSCALYASAFIFNKCILRRIDENPGGFR